MSQHASMPCSSIGFFAHLLACPDSYHRSPSAFAIVVRQRFSLNSNDDSTLVKTQMSMVLLKSTLSELAKNSDTSPA